MKIGDILTDGTVKWVVRHIAHPVVGTIVDWQSGILMRDGFLKCTGAGIAPEKYPLLKGILPLVNGLLILPDRRGVVPRGLDDGRGLDAGRLVNTYQGDAIRNIIGYLNVSNLNFPSAFFHSADYAFRLNWEVARHHGWGDMTMQNVMGGTDFSAGRVVPTAAENRMQNVSTTYWICYA